MRIMEIDYVRYTGMDGSLDQHDERRRKQIAAHDIARMLIDGASDVTAYRGDQICERARVNLDTLTGLWPVEDEAKDRIVPLAIKYSMEEGRWRDLSEEEKESARNDIKEELIQTAELMESIAQGLELNDPDLTKRSAEILRDTAEMIKLGEEMKK